MNAFSSYSRSGCNAPSTRTLSSSLRLLGLAVLAIAAAFCSGCASNVPSEWAERGDGRLVRDQRYRMGYVQSQSDAVKREYFRRQDLERVPGGAGVADQPDTGRQVYYTLPGPKETHDGVSLAPHPITVPIQE